MDDLAAEADRALSDIDLKIDDTSVDHVKDSARDIGRAFDGAEDEARRLELATAAVERNVSESESETRDLERALNRADHEADQVATSTGKISSGFAGIRSSIVGLGVAFAGTAAIAGAIRLAGDARTAFADLQDSVNAVKVVFGEASTPVLAFADDVAQTAGLSMAAFNQAASVLGSSLINVGFGADVAAQKTIELTQRAADMASIFGGEVSVAVEAILSALRGEGNPIERFGVTLTEAKVQAEAAALGFSKVGGEFDSTAKAAARLEIIMRETDRTANDFANTSGDLANAQKVAAAEFVNAQAALGEALLPVFQAFLDIGPEVLGAVEELAPGLASLAVSAGNLLTSTPGVLDFVDALHLLVDLPRGFGALFDSLRLGVEGFGTASNALTQVIQGDLFGAIETVKEGFDGMGDEANRIMQRIQTQGLIDDLREGGDAATVLASRLAEVAKKGKIDPAFIAGLSKIAGVDLQTNVAVLVNLITNAERLKLAADDVEAFRISLALLNDLGRGDGPIRSVTDRIREIPEAVPEGVSALQDLQDAADLAGLSLGEFALSTDPVIEGLVNALDPADQLALKLDAVRSGATTAGDAFSGNLTPSIGDVNDALQDLNDNGTVSLNEFITSLASVGTAILNFQTNLSTIALTAPGLATEIGQLPLEIGAQLAQQLVDDPIRIAEAEAARTLPAELATTIRGIVARGVGLLQTNPAQVKAFTEFVTTIDNPAAVTALTEHLDDALLDSFELLNIPMLDLVPTGIQGRDTLIDGLVKRDTGEEAALLASFADLELDLTSVGIPAGATLMGGVVVGVSSPAAIDRLHDAIVDATNNALEARSPSRVMLDLGESAGDAFWSGFNQSELTLKTSVPAVTGTITGGTAGTSIGGANVNINLANATLGDAVSDVARMAQIAGSVAATYNAVRN